MAHSDEAELRLTEERLARVGVLQELTVAALDLFDPALPMDEFLDRLATRLGCLAALCLEHGAQAPSWRLISGAGLSRPSLALSLGKPGEHPATAALPYPELDRPGLVRWHFPVTSAPDVATSLLLLFDGPPALPAQYYGMVSRLSEIVRAALVHRSLYERSLDSERRLLEQKTLLECQMEASTNAILFAGDRGEVSFNRRFAEVFGLPHGAEPGFEELARLMSAALEVPEAMAGWSDWAPGREAPACHGEVRHRDGRTFDLFCAPVRRQGGAALGRGWYLHDVTPQKRAAEDRSRLLAQEQRARALAEEAQGRAFFLAEASRLLAGSLDYAATLERVANLALPSFADWCMVDLIEEGQGLRRVALAHVEPDKHEVAEQLRRCSVSDPRAAPAWVAVALHTGQAQLHPVVGAQTLRELCDDEAHLALLQQLGVGAMLVVPLTARGRRLGVITLGYGSSGRSYGEADLTLAEDLACRAALAVDNARLYGQMQEAVRNRDEFLSIASHELRTPVTSLRLAAQGLLRMARAPGGFEKAPASFLGASLETAVRQANRMAALIDKLLDLSRIRAGRLDLQLEQVDLAEVVREICAQTAEERAHAGCELELTAEGPVVGRWDRGRLEQVVANLLSNACKYGAGRPVKVTLSCEAAVARLEVADQGIGIPAESQERIFERFERAVSASHYAGLGLGLYIVRRVLDALGGKVGVASQPGAGAIFRIELPLAGPETSAQAQRGAA